MQQMHRLFQVFVEIIMELRLNMKAREKTPHLCSILRHMRSHDQLSALFLAVVFSPRVKRAASATWPQEAGKSVKSWPLTSAHAQCKQDISTVQCDVWSNMSSQITYEYDVFSYFLSTEEGSTQRHLYRYCIYFSSSQKHQPFIQ